MKNLQKKKLQSLNSALDVAESVYVCGDKTREKLVLSLSKKLNVDEVETLCLLFLSIGLKDKAEIDECVDTVANLHTFTGLHFVDVEKQIDDYEFWCRWNDKDSKDLDCVKDYFYASDVSRGRYAVRTQTDGGENYCFFVSTWSEIDRQCKSDLARTGDHWHVQEVVDRKHLGLTTTVGEDGSLEWNRKVN